MDLYLPAFTGNHPNFITLTIWCNLSGLPPFIIRSINNMEDISKFEVQSLTGKATVFSFVIIEKGSRVRRKSSQLLVIMMLLIVNKHRILKMFIICVIIKQYIIAGKIMPTSILYYIYIR